ncbi:MAG: DUF2304 domain-containing protein [bacterium]|nr:DUF2304 domain-containing protein [bacterium]
MLILFQILFTLFALFAIGSVLNRKKAGQLSLRGSIFWAGFWLLTIIAVLWPNSTTVLANALGIGRGTDFVLYISIIVIFYLLFRLHIKIEGVSRDMTKIVRKNTLDEGEK